MKQPANAIDEHIAAFPASTQKMLQQLRQTIQKAAPEATETIGYGIPTYKLYGNLVHFSGYDHHIGFYPAPAAIEKFKDELADYKGAKGSVQFPLDKPLPLALIKKIVEFRVAQNLAKAPKKKKTAAVSPKPSATKAPATKADPGFAATLPAPARRALDQAGISTIKKLSGYTEAAVAALHGIGPSSIPKLKAALQQAGLSFKKAKQ